VRADVIVESCVVVELKSIAKLRKVDLDQCRMYMHFLGLTNGLVINFGSADGLESTKILP
jgi:hypothetical protein